MESKKQHQLSAPSPTFHSASRWWSNETVAVVTGANKGIGYAFVKKFAELGLTVVLTARDNSRGLKAVETLLAQGLVNVHFQRLDVSEPSSVKSFVAWFKHKFGALDILVNNAAVSFNDIDENSIEHAETVIRTNFFGPKLLVQSLLPLFTCSPSKSRILNISSRLGQLNKVRNPIIREMLEDEERLSEQQIDRMAYMFLDDIKQGTWQSKGWPKLWTDYSVSKLAFNAYSKVLSKRYEGRGLSVNCFCPGFTQTSMTRGKGNHTADDAAEYGARVVLLPPHQLPTGKFFMAGSNLVCSKL